MFHFYAGDPVEMLQLRPDGGAAIVMIGNDLAAGASAAGRRAGRRVAGLPTGAGRPVGAVGLHRRAGLRLCRLRGSNASGAGARIPSTRGMIAADLS